MKVLKFGGTSVGSAASALSVKHIVESLDCPAAVVVSALGGVTDELIAAARAAEAGDESYKGILSTLGQRHLALIGDVIPAGEVRDALVSKVKEMLAELDNLCLGTFLLKSLSPKTMCGIVSFGERLSSHIYAALIDGAKRFDALDFIRTHCEGGKEMLDDALTYELVRKAFDGFSGVAVVPGFIGRNRDNGDIVTLGRGGSDYTASILAAALDADCLEIWTDVDGFMTADPRIIKTSYVIGELSFDEAMELCNFGAKVVYAPALYPVKPKDIPVLIKNTFNPEAPGTVIRKSASSGRTVTGITSIDDICLLTLSGPSMVGIIGVDSRLFGALSAAGISVFLVSQSSSETGISVGVSGKEVERAREAVDREFASEIRRGAMDPVQVSTDLAAVAVVGADMKHSKGVAGKLFTILGRNGIGVLACAQGSSVHNISMIVERHYLRKALNVIHDSFFLSEYQELNLFLCGIGTVGGKLIEQIASQRERLMRERHLKINIVGIARSKKGIFTRDGIDLACWKEQLAGGIDMSLEKLREEVIGMNIFNSVFVDCTASDEVATLYKDFFEHGISVVAANKVAASSDYEVYAELKKLALARGVKFLFETNVGAGLPIINTINALRNSGDKIEKIEAVVSGTLNFIFNTISADIPFSKTVRMAQEQGFSEPDPRIDLSGKDVIRKLVILAREAGCKVNQEDVEAKLFVPEELFACSMEEFWRRLPELDEGFEKERQRLEAEGKHWRFVARMDGDKYSVSLCEVDSSHPFYNLEGSNNIILLTTERYHVHPMLIQGYGAGASVTAAGVFADIMSIANI